MVAKYQTPCNFVEKNNLIEKRSTELVVSKFSYKQLYEKRLLPLVDIDGIGSQATLDRTDYVREDTSQDMKILEIAPLFAPLFPQGPNVKNVDVQSREDNVKKFSDVSSWPRKTWPSDWESHFADVHYIWDGTKRLTELIIDEKFDRIVGSHVIEHIPNLVLWLQDLYDLLVPGGEVRMIVPDMRFNWDYRRSKTDLKDIIDNYLENKIRPDFGTYFEQVLFAPQSVNLDAHALWARPPYDREFGMESVLTDSIYDLALLNTLSAKDRTILMKTYEDAHINRWTPSSCAFQLIKLHQLKLTKLKLVNLVPTRPGSAEFYITLKRPLD